MPRNAAGMCRWTKALKPATRSWRKPSGQIQPQNAPRARKARARTAMASTRLDECTWGTNTPAVRNVTMVSMPPNGQIDSGLVPIAPAATTTVRSTTTHAMYSATAAWTARRKPWTPRSEAKPRRGRRIAALAGGRGLVASIMVMD